MNPNTPVIIGVGQILQRVSDPRQSQEPIDMMVRAVRQAAADAGNPGLLGAVDSVRVARGAWRYRQPAGYVAAAIGSPDAERVGTCYGGNMVQKMLNLSALDILDGRHSLVALTGAETGNTQARARKAGLELPRKATDGAYDRMLGREEPMSADAEIARRITRPVQVYPMFENALRYSRGESVAAHGERVSELWSRFSQVAADNPGAWIREAVDARTIRTPGPGNRRVSFPYPKLMNSNNAVDMAAAILMCSHGQAEQLGIDESRRVYPWTGTDACDTPFVSARDNLHSSAAIRIAGARALEMAGLSPGEVEFVDIYSCFPSAVQVAAKELGFGTDRDLTVTGGMTFGGGPLNNYVMHSIARMVEVLRAHPGCKGLVTANGGFLTKHAFGVYSTQAPAADFQYCNLQDEVDRQPRRAYLVDHDGQVTIESYTVMFSGDEPAVGHAACITPDGKRTWANTADRELMDAMQVEEFCGKSARIDGAGGLSV